MTSPEQIKEWIEAGLAGSTASVSGDGRHFDAVIICPAFAGCNTLKRHRMVYAALGTKMQAEIHALSMQTFTPDERKS